MADQSRIFFSIQNTKQLPPKAKSSASFSQQGGTIGSSDKDFWSLTDLSRQVKASHCRIGYSHNRFHIKNEMGQIFINASKSPLHQGQLSKLNEGDNLQIGPYKILVSFQMSSSTDPMKGLEDSFEQSARELINSPKTEEAASQAAALEGSSNETPNIDPVSALDAVENASALLQDKKKQLKKKSKSTEDTSLLDVNEQRYQGSSYHKKSIGGGELQAAFTCREIENISREQESTPVDPIRQDNDKPDLLKNLGKAFQPKEEHNLMSDNTLVKKKGTENSLDLNFQASNASQGFSGIPASSSSNNRLVSSPLMRGLGAKVGNVDNDSSMHALSEEIGATLQAAIKGLLALHAQVKESRYGMIDKNLQPIEDNPLRLGLSYEETLGLLLDTNKSPVHLSAPSAISESLDNINNHNDAIQSAISEALSYILKAFSPEVLIKRFTRYQRASDITPQDQESWAWTMYENYYKELTSDRQKGFEKLFWEIFDQAYDRKIREKQIY